MLLESKSIRLRLVEETDAEFILELRLNEKYNQFLSTVDPDLESQKKWIKNYKNDEFAKKQFYFIVERLDMTPCGTVRVYDLKEDSFSWGSWILNENKTRYSALESAFLIYKFGFEKLGYKKSNFEVMKGNERVVSFHKRMGAIEINEDLKNYYFEITKKTVHIAQEKLASKLK